jgi:hypothetical protein
VRTEYWTACSLTPYAKGREDLRTHRHYLVPRATSQSFKCQDLFFKAIFRNFCWRQGAIFLRTTVTSLLDNYVIRNLISLAQASSSSMRTKFQSYITASEGSEICISRGRSPSLCLLAAMHSAMHCHATHFWRLSSPLSSLNT